MLLKDFDSLPESFKTEETGKYHDILKKRKAGILLKRIFDVVASFCMLIVCLPFFLLISIAIKCDSKGKVLFTQSRVTRYGKVFKIYKFRTMVSDAEKLGTQVTVSNDMRITGVGRFLRKYRLDEIPQLLNILKGDMSFVGTRPEVIKYVEAYTPEMYATLLLPAGVTSLTSIYYKDEDSLLSNSENADETYINEILPQKMKYNLNYIKKFSFWYDIKIMLMTVFAVCRTSEKIEQDDASKKETVKN